MSVEPDVDAVEIRYPPELPVSQRRDEIAAAIRDHQVVIVAGETGSGKTTQIPKICLELGRGRSGLIGHTQPRRIAARSVAERIASELGTELGQRVGYTVRFTDQVSRGTQVRLMTDGILLAEIQRDPTLRRYDTIIVDEAHERSLNIDFILGYLHQLLPRRPDLKVVITSATIDSARFSEHFGGAPVVEVSGRTFPVEVRYRPVHDPDAAPGTPAADPDRDQISAIVDGVAELQREGDGDVLVFLSGEREIRDTADGLRDAVGRKQIRDVDVLPLYARLSAAEQHRVFASHSGQRVVLATNVAETSLTVPGIRYVIDPGTARISRYSLRTKVQRLPIEPVSQASARQRAGRCGRVADGICLRLYSEEDFDSRPEYTDPEILRTNLASVILQMTAIGLGDVAAFPFVEPPDVRAVRDGVALLEELHAIEVGGGPSPRLTRTGRRLVRLPVDPRMARMVLEADRLGCVHEVLVIAAALSIQDPRERPADAQQAADEQHRRFADERSDFLAYLNLWEYLREQQEELSSSAFRRMCKREHLHFLRVREWQDLHSQLRRVCKDLKIELSRTAATGSERDAVDADRVHQALLAGLLSHVGVKDERAAARAAGKPQRGRRPLTEYQGARGISFAVFPGSALARTPPDCVVAAELVETSRMWARTVARVEPEWVEQLAAHLVKRTYAEPHWSARRGSVVARERVTLYGMPLVADRAVQYGRIDPETSRELFIRHALVEGDWRTRHDFFHANRQLLEDVGELEHRTRRRDIVVDDETLFSFYDKRIPPTVVSGAHFDRWWKGARRETPDLLTFTEADVVDEAAEQVSQDDFPDRWHVGGLDLAVGYRFEPGSPEDGVTVTVPAAVLNQVPEGAFEWQVPGLRHELVTELIRSLPKPVRRHLAPAPDNARRALEQLQPHEEPLLPALSRELGRLAGVPVPVGDFDWEKVPPHLRVRVRVTGRRGKQVAAGKTVQEVGREAAGTVQEAISASARRAGLEVEGLTAWTIGDLPREFSTAGPGGPVTGYPALVDTRGRVDVRVLPSRVEQERAMRRGTRRLLLAGASVPSAGTLTDDWDSVDRLALTRAPHGSLAALVLDVAAAVVDDVAVRHGGPAWEAAGFERLQDAVARELPGGAAQQLRVVARILASTRQVERAVTEVTSLQVLSSLTDVKDHLARLVRPGFVADTGVARLPDVQRYLRALLRRVEVLGTDPHRDGQHLWQVQELQAELEHAVASVPADSPGRDALAEVRWMLEELRVSLFAQSIGTPKPVSPQRIRKALAAALAPPA